MAFIHLHVHTEYSLLDGMTSIDELIKKCGENNMNSVAITDHGNIYGAIALYKKAKANRIKPIIGCEMYTTRDGIDKKINKELGHIILLAENNEGYHSLCKLVSTSFVEGFYYKPRIDFNLLRENHDGLIALSACVQGDVQKTLLQKGYEEGKKVALELLDIFGENNFFLEIQNQGLEDELRLKPLLKQLSADINVPLVATNDIHYANKEDAEAHDALLCIETNRKIDEEDRMRFPNDEFYFKSEQEMSDLFYDMPEAIEMSQKIADRCEISFENIDNESAHYHLPTFNPPDNKSSKDYLKELCLIGLNKKYGENAKEHLDRLNMELDIINSMGFTDYFLIVWDFINYANNNDIAVGPGRGSAAGSIVSYSLNITDIDPIQFDLFFERFLNPERVSMPDIDIDFENRNKMVEYVTKKYGSDKVSQIITYSKLKAKAVIKDIARVMDIDFNSSNNLTKPFPTVSSWTLKDALHETPEILKAEKANDSSAIATLSGARNLKELASENIRYKKLIRICEKLEGRIRGAGIHAAGVVITDKPITSYLPLSKNKDEISSGFDKDEVEELGLLKMDFLGLETLVTIKNALRMIEQNHGVKIDFTKDHSYDDPKVYELLSSGNTYGVFQLESHGMIEFFKKLKPKDIEDVTAGISLYRPGPMDSIQRFIDGKAAPEKISYPHEKLKEVLSVTYGCIVYQEQVMQIVRDLAGYSLARSDLVRKAMGKKKQDVMEKEESIFIYGNDSYNVTGCVKNGIPEQTAKKIWEDMADFAKYAFNKSHAASYAINAYRTAYLKCHYPKEFLAATMTSSINITEKIKKYMSNATSMGIKTTTPNLLESEYDFSVKDGKIVFALGALKGVGHSAVDEIISLRDKIKEIDLTSDRSFQEFVELLDTSKVNKTALEAFINSGATDIFKGTRAQKRELLPMILDKAKKQKPETNSGQQTLFDLDPNLTTATNIWFELPANAIDDEKLNLDLEVEVSGIHLSGHPIAKYHDVIQKLENLKDTTFVRDKDDYYSGQNKTVKFVYADEILDETNPKKLGNNSPIRGVFMLSSIRKVTTKKGDPMAFLEVEDETEKIVAVVFPRFYKKVESVLIKNEIVVIKGTIQKRKDEQTNIIADLITPIEVVKQKLSQTS